MSTHKAMARRCLSYHQAASGQHAIWALATAPLRRLALSVLFTVTTTSYQTTLYSLQEIFNKRQHANATYRVEFSHYDSNVKGFLVFTVHRKNPAKKIPRYCKMTGALLQRTFLKTLHRQQHYLFACGAEIYDMEEKFIVYTYR